METLQHHQQQHQDPIILSPEAEPDDFVLSSSSNENSNDKSSTSMTDGDIKDSTVESVETNKDGNEKTSKLLQVRNQVIYDALGNKGEYTGKINVSSALSSSSSNMGAPQGNGEMVYENTISSSESNNAGTVSTTLVASYKGSWEQGYWQGHGTQNLNNGDRFIGDFQQSKRIFGEYKWKDQEQRQHTNTSEGSEVIIRKQRTYQGEFHDNGRPHGHGKYTWTTITTTLQDGHSNDDDDDSNKKNTQTSVSTYIGMFNNGQRSGHGCFTSSKLQYTGDWMEGKYHGYGVLKIPSQNRTYKGQFHRGVKDGHGEETLYDGTIIHKGLWRQDRPVKEQENPTNVEEDYLENEEGQNDTSAPPSGPISTVYQSPQEIFDGEGVQGMYKGIVEEFLPSGVGTITYEKNQHPTGIIQYEGFFDRGIRQGYGRAEFGNGDTYHGNWNNGIFEGNGEYLFANGRMYKGTWSKGLPHDKNAKFHWPNNTSFEGVYEHGHRKLGRLIFPNGSYYDGEFLSPEGSYGGQGKLVTLMVTYEGEFCDGQFHGQGSLKKNNGFVIFDGTWKEGKALREDVMIAIPEDLLEVPMPPPDVDFGALDDLQDTSTNLLSALKRTITPTPKGNDATLQSLSATIVGTSSKLLGTLTSTFTGGHEDQVKAYPLQTHEVCKAVVDMAVSDAQDNPGRYTGILHMESQRPHGVGRMVYKDGNRIHEGFWSHGNREGHGRCMFAKIGDYHEGEYKQNLRHGPGKYYWKDGRQFVGNYDMDERSGEGKFIYPNGDVYVGHFVKGSRTGFGEFTFSNRTCSYRGQWQNSAYEGVGRLQWTSPKGLHVYEGEFHEGLFHGEGTEYINDNVKRKGIWSNGLYQKETQAASTTPNSEKEEESDSHRNEDNDNNTPATIVPNNDPSKDECPTTLEQNYSDSRSQWKDALEPENT